MHAPNEFLHIDYSARLAMCVAQVVATLATQKAGEAASGEQAAAKSAHATEGKKPSFLESFQKSGGQLFFVGCDCGTAGCVIFDQGKEKILSAGVCRPAKQQKTA